MLVKKRPIFLLIILVMGFANLAHSQDTLKVLTYNIYHGEQNYNPSQSNLKGIAAVINKVQPDLVALQEVDSATTRSAKLNKGQAVDEVRRLAELTGMHGYFGKAMNYDGGGYGEGILSKKMLKSKRISLPIPAGGEPRALLMVIYPLSNGGQLIFGGTHLCHQFEENRIVQVSKINTFFSSIDKPIIIAGDFNFTPYSTPYKTLLNDKWRDAAKYLEETEPTYSFKDPNERIDYIFLSQDSNIQWDPLNVRVLSKYDYSDHMPVVATIVILEK